MKRTEKLVNKHQICTHCLKDITYEPNCDLCNGYRFKEQDHIE